MDKYSAICAIGSGACGSVYLVRNLENKKLYALKKIQLDESRKTRTQEAVEREARILSELRHPHIVAYHDSFLQKGEELSFLCIIQDYCDGGTLEEKIKEAAGRKQNMPEKQVMQWFLQIALAVRYMHGKKVLHRDLKTANVFLNKAGTLCKLGDFGIAKSMDTTIDVASTCVGTPCYLSPEMCQDIPYTSKADIWALGCMLYEMLALRPAFDAHNLVSLFYKIVQGQYEPLPACYSGELQETVAAILTLDADARPSARGVLKLPYLRQQLTKFVEEKEFILQQIRVPTRQGSRPYSTSNISSRSSTESIESHLVVEESSGAGDKRASSCRPTLVGGGGSRGHVKERSLLASAKPGVNGRVSTIPEESEDQLAERNQKIEAAIRLNQIREEERANSSTPTRSRSSTPGSKSGVKKGVNSPSRLASNNRPSAGTPDNRSTSNKEKVLPVRSKSVSDTYSKDPKTTTTTTQKATSKTNKDLNSSSAKKGAKDSNKTAVKSEEKQKLTKAKSLEDNNNKTAADKDSGGVKVSPYSEGVSDTPGVRSHSEGRGAKVTTIKESPPTDKKSVSMVKMSPYAEDLRLSSSQLDKRKPAGDKVDGQWALEESLHLQLSEDESDSDDTEVNAALEEIEANTAVVSAGDETRQRRQTDGLKSTSLPKIEGIKRENQLILETNKRNRVPEPATRTPRIQNPNPLVIQISISNEEDVTVANDATTTAEPGVHKRVPKVSNPLGGLVIKPETPQTIQRLPSIGTENSFLSNSCRKKGKRSSAHSRRMRRRASLESGIMRPSTRDSAHTVPYEPSMDYYSDDFEGYTSGSDIEEDIPEELSVVKTSRSYSFTTGHDIPEIEEDLPDGAVADDFDDFLTEDGDEVEEELDEVLTVAREACEDLDGPNTMDDTIVDSGGRPGTTRLIRKHCLDIIGKDKYEKVQKYCENNKQIDLKKIEKIVGKDNVKTVLLMTELSKKTILK